MTVFRKAVLERKKNNINGVLFDDTSKIKMKAILFFMIATVLLLLFLGQKKIEVYTSVQIEPYKGPDTNKSCFIIAPGKTKKIEFEPGELLNFSISRKDQLNGSIVYLSNDSIFCIKLTEEKNKQIHEIIPGTTIYIWKKEKTWYFLYEKIKGSTGL